MRSTLLATLAMAAGLAFATGAHAVAVTGTTNGTLSGLSACNNPSTCSTPDSNTLLWGKDSSGQSLSLSNSSSLLTIDGAINDTDGIDVTLGQLKWFNRSTTDSLTDDSFNINWSLSDVFTSPIGTGSITNLGLNIQNTNNPQGDLIVGFSPGSFVSNVPGYTLTNLELVASGGGTYSNGVWKNPEDNSSTLTLRGDFIANTTVPEPMSLSLFGVGLIGLGAMRRLRRGAKTEARC
jgi:hypothetical protein